jgi:hypothetical protein
MYDLEFSSQLSILSQGTPADLILSIPSDSIELLFPGISIFSVEVRSTDQLLMATGALSFPTNPSS